MTTLGRATHRILPSLALVTLAVACVDDAPRSIIAPDVSLARRSTDPTVTSTNPSYGARGQAHLTVRIYGSGYDSSARATWERGGVVDTMITVWSTTYISSSELLADISIAADADTALYDVAVTADNGRKKGVGVEMFQVGEIVSVSGAVTADRQPISVVADDATWLSLRYDNTGQKALFVGARNFAQTIADGTGPCVANNSDISKADMLAKLFEAAGPQELFIFEVYRPALGVPSAEHSLFGVFGGDTLVRVRIGEPVPPTWLPYPPNPIVEQTGPNSYLISGGVVKIHARGTTKGAGKYGTLMYCPNQDSVTVTYPVAP